MIEMEEVKLYKKETFIDKLKNKFAKIFSRYPKDECRKCSIRKTCTVVKNHAK